MNLQGSESLIAWHCVTIADTGNRKNEHLYPVLLQKECAYVAKVRMLKHEAQNSLK